MRHGDTERLREGPRGDAVARAHAEAEAEAIGPRGSALLAVPGAPELFVKVDAGSLAEVRAAANAAGTEGLDSVSEWSVFKESAEPEAEYMSLGLRLTWPTIGVERFLFFPVSEWRTELALIDQRAQLYLWESGTPMAHAIRSDCPTDLIGAALAVTGRQQ